MKIVGYSASVSAVCVQVSVAPTVDSWNLDRIPLHTIWWYVLVCESGVMGYVCVCVCVCVCVVRGRGKGRLKCKTLSFMVVPCANFSKTNRLSHYCCEWVRECTQHEWHCVRHYTCVGVAFMLSNMSARVVPAEGPGHHNFDEFHNRYSLLSNYTAGIIWGEPERATSVTALCTCNVLSIEYSFSHPASILVQ